ncbi:kinase-like domain-containing protein [Gigaspora rosea]|uniref:Kinase-like domain-containing protein n=1 Tax=Gigaspora rosea TaxID=44941 RepID=A0A397VZ81_9GLOM|nr:kinase-like domain-containing protein [Gigaspora rosea]
MEVETTTPKSLYEYLEKLESYLLDENIKSFKFSQFHNNELIGRGGFAIVSSAVFQETKYALKDLKVNLIIDDKMIKNIINEIKLLNKLNHPNINKFYGISRDPLSNNFALVLQYVNGGNLRNYLFKKKQNGIYRIAWTDLIKISIDIANGLTYLHNINIIHRDLHSKNILINDGKALIADFGISKQLNDMTGSSSYIKGIPAYTDPQYLLNKLIDKRSDIYSLGVLFWELTSGIPPFHKLSLFEVAKKIIDNQKEKAIANTPQDFISLYEKCWSSSPDQRPTLHKILKQLKKLLNKTPVEFIENHISNKQYINAIIINQGHCTFTFEDLDKSTDLRDVRRRLSTEKDLLLGRQNVYFYDQHGEKISRDHENNYTLEDILIPDGSDFSFYIESDLSKPSFPKIVQLFGLDKGRKFDDGIMNTASQQAFTIQNLHEKDINIQNEYSINIGESNPVYYQTGYIRLTRDDLQVSDEYIKAIEDALDDNKSVEEKRGALNEIGREFGHFWMQDIKLGRIPIQIEEMTDSASTDGSIMYQQIVASSSRT